LSFPVLTIEFDAHPQLLLLLAAAAGCRRKAGSAQQVDQIFKDLEEIWTPPNLADSVENI
jgi:hypothetical protein